MPKLMVGNVPAVQKVIQANSVPNAEHKNPKPGIVHPAVQRVTPENSVPSAEPQNPKLGIARPAVQKETKVNSVPNAEAPRQPNQHGIVPAVPRVLQENSVVNVVPKRRIINNE